VVTGESAGPPAKKPSLDLVLVYGGFDGKKVVGSLMTIDPGASLGVIIFRASSGLHHLCTFPPRPAWICVLSFRRVEDRD
jgi:hypothetical protein